MMLGEEQAHMYEVLYSILAVKQCVDIAFFSKKKSKVKVRIVYQ